MKIVLIGSGNVACHLGKALKKCGHEIVFVYSRNSLHAKKLAKELKCKWGNNLKILQHFTAHVYIIAVKDDAIEKIVQQMPIVNGLVLHTSGTTALHVLHEKYKHCGVLWPIQTIHRHSKVNFKNIPIVVEANNAQAKKLLKRIVNHLSNKVYSFTLEQRRALHLAAVWVNNFTNHLYVLAEDLLKKYNMPFSLLTPLIQSTAEKGMKNPRKVQTGPAIRNDKHTMHTHIKLLSSKDQKTIYKLLSRNILRTQKQKR